MRSLPLTDVGSEPDAAKQSAARRQSSPSPTHQPVDVCCGGPDRPLMPIADAEHLTEIFKALADPTRVRLLQYLAESKTGTVCACHLPSALGISQPTLSFHLTKLHDAGLIDREKRGRWVHWSIAPGALELAGTFLDATARSGVVVG